MTGATESGAADARPLLLVVDDDALVADSLAFALGADYRVHTAGTRAEAIELVRRLAEPPQLALVDLGLPPAPHDPEEGFRLIEELIAHSPRMRIVVLSGQSEAAHARHARALGAIEFVAKPCEPEPLRRVLARALAFRAADLRRVPAGEELIGQSPALAKLKNQIAQFADSPFPVLIEGPSGSGKELVARSLHRLSARAGRPFLALNCAAIAPTLVEAALFGYAKGAFTGASAGRSGYFEDAGEGTLLLDEIGELPLELQPKLLRVLENGEFQRVGETQVRVRARACSRRPTATCVSACARARFAPISTTGCRCSRWRCRRCATWTTTGCCCSSISAASTPPRRASSRFASIRPPKRCGAPIRFPATCASCATS
ncbi:MAG: sigma 54-interacting transcriptional regulator [Burkholderiales bacterium]|nr:sigma 54-interacting transcriptional regulator [Burkholderiales bacterium]